MSSRVAAITGGSLIVLLGLARGIGGLVLLTARRGSIVAVDPAPGHLILVGAGLLVVAVLCAGSGVAVLLGRRSGVTLGLVALAVFVAGGVMNGIVLFGSPRPVGLGLNILVAVLIAALLLRARIGRPSRG